MRRVVHSRVSALGLDVSVGVKFYSRSAIEKSRSLEQLVIKFGRGERVYDPMGVFDDAERLVNFARELRLRLADKLKGIYWSARWRTTYVVLNERAFADEYCLSRQKLAAAERTVVNAYEATAGNKGADRIDEKSNELSGRSGAAASHNVRLCFNIPAMPVVAVDEPSIPRGPVRWRTFFRLADLRTVSRVPLLTVLFGVSSAGIASAKLPGIENTPMHTGAETSGTTSAVSASGPAVTIAEPIDAAVLLPSEGSDPFPGGAGLHLLWRDPIHGAVGEGLASLQTPAGMLILKPQISPLAGSDEVIGRDQLREVAKSGATFGGPANVAERGRLDLKWVGEGEAFPTGGQDGSTGRLRSSPSPIMQSGVAALLGLSKLARDDLSGQAYATLLEDVRFHLGLSRSLQLEMRWQFDNATRSSRPLRRDWDSSDQKASPNDYAVEEPTRPRGYRGSSG
jgi:hypothetical protein